MKKITLAFVILSMVLSFGGAVMAQDGLLEKIASPAQIKNFVNIRKVGPSLFGIRKAPVAKSPVFISTSSVSCVGSAIDKKDQAVKSAISARSTSLLSAIDSRTSCQKSAIEKTTAKDQVEANKVCLNTFRASILSANKTADKAKKDSWTTYVSDLKSCSASTAEVISIPDGGDSTDGATTGSTTASSVL